MDPVPPPPTPRWLKYVIDRVLALSFTILLAPPHLLILVAIKIEDALTGQLLASPFYFEPRVSGGQRFRIIKFRILKPSRLKALRTDAGGDDPRDGKRDRDPPKSPHYTTGTMRHTNSVAWRGACAKGDYWR